MKKGGFEADKYLTFNAKKPNIKKTKKSLEFMLVNIDKRKEKTMITECKMDMNKLVGLKVETEKRSVYVNHAEIRTTNMQLNSNKRQNRKNMSTGDIIVLESCNVRETYACNVFFQS